MARHEWTYPYDHREYEGQLAEGHGVPHFELVREVETGKGSFCGAGHAWEVYDSVNGVRCLQSYSTIVSVVRGDRVIHLGNWSRTTTHHQNLFGSLVSR